MDFDSRENLDVLRLRFRALIDDHKIDYWFPLVKDEHYFTEVNAPKLWDALDLTFQEFDGLMS
jgi:hypothetical protein